MQLKKKEEGPSAKTSRISTWKKNKSTMFRTRLAPKEWGAKGRRSARSPPILITYFLEREEAPLHPRSRAEWVAPMSAENKSKIAILH